MLDTRFTSNQFVAGTPIPDLRHAASGKTNSECDLSRARISRLFSSIHSNTLRLRLRPLPGLFLHQFLLRQFADHGLGQLVAKLDLARQLNS